MMAINDEHEANLVALGYTDSGHGYWVSPNRGWETCIMVVRRNGRRELCADDAVDSMEWPDRQPVCRRHLERFEDWALQRHHELVQIETDRRIEANTAAEKAKDARTVVYFLRRANGDIKIGFSSDLPQRRRALTREHGPLELLATLRGGRPVERDLHSMFAADRQGDTEWFAPSSDLLAFLETVTVQVTGRQIIEAAS